MGLTHVKTVAFDPSGRIIDHQSVAYATQRAGAEIVEQDAEDWWAATRSGLAAIWARGHVRPGDVAGLTVTGHMHALVLVDRDGSALGPALVLGDRRALAQARTITDKIGADKIQAITGAELDPSMPAAKALWLAENSPETLARVRALLSCKDWLRHRLTGDLLSDPIDACATSLFDIRAGSWSEPLIAVARVRIDQLPTVVDPTTPAGGLLPAAAADLGLPAGLPVIVGAGDDVEVLGNGLLTGGESLEHLGTTGSILTVSDRFVLDPDGRLEIYPHVLPGVWVLGGSMTTAGSAIGWAARLLSEEDPYARLELDPDVSPPVFLPHLAGERVPSRLPHARGAWLNLTMNVDGDCLLQGVMLGVAFALRAILQRIESSAGPQRRITVSGGYDVQPQWLAVRSAAYGRALGLLETEEPTALGAAIVAAAGLGIHPDVASAVAAMTRIRGEVVPDQWLAARLDDEYRVWQAGHDALEPLWTAVSTEL